MNDQPAIRPIDPGDFDIVTLDDEIRADRQCTELLKQFAASLVAQQQLTPLESGRLAHGADPFLRDFIIANRRENLFRLPAGRVRQFAGHFYIVNNLEPNRKELATMLDGIAAFYRYAVANGWCSPELLPIIESECAALDTYAARIESFWSLEGDGFLAWRKEIPID